MGVEDVLAGRALVEVLVALGSLVERDHGRVDILGDLHLVMQDAIISWRLYFITGPWGARSRVSCCVLVLVDQSAEDIAAAQLTNGRWTYQISTHRRHRRRVGQAAVRAPLVVMLEVAS